jgi:hypothetical protein
MYLTKQVKIDTLKAIENDLLHSYEMSKSKEVSADGAERLRIMRAQDGIHSLHRSVEKLIAYYETVAK